MRIALRFGSLVTMVLLASPCLAQDPDPEELVYQPTNEDAFKVLASGGQFAARTG